MVIKIYTDGGARGNPGVAGYGVVAYDWNGKKLFSEGKSLGIKTNNEAEYMGLIAALNWAINSGNKEIELYSDSQLLVRQMRGEYKVKAANLKKLWLVAKTLAQSLEIKFIDIRRELNIEADRLANLAMDGENVD